MTDLWTKMKLLGIGAIAGGAIVIAISSSSGDSFQEEIAAYKKELMK